MRLLHAVVIVALVVAAAYVYRIKFESTVQAERVAKLRVEIRREREAIAALRAEWAKLETPARIQALAQKHLTLKRIEPYQFGGMDRVGDRPLDLSGAGDDPIGAMIDSIDTEILTGSLPAPEKGQE
jgi:cell division protein FtsL